MQLSDLFNPSLLGRNAAPALEHGAGTLTFGDLEARSNRLAALLHHLKIQRGDRLAVFLPNCVEFIDVFLACIKLGIIMVPMNILYRDREISHILEDAAPAAVVTTRELRYFIPAEAGRHDIHDIEELSKAAADFPAAHVRRDLDGDDPAAILYTSGTTGRSKGAVLTHNNLAANTVNLLACWQIAAQDRYLAVLPLFHAHGLANGIHIWLASGCRMRLAERFDAAQALHLFQTFKPTLFFGVPTIYVRLLELPAEAAKEIGSRMRLFVSGSAPLAANVFESFREKFGHAILERYGMSETLMNTGNPYEGERRPGSVGFPFPGVSVKIVDGELVVRGPNVSPGYWNQAPRAELWFNTGDLAERSADGYITLRGRKSDLIISGGFNIYPREIEELLLEQPGVREAAVCGVTDMRRGELPVAYVVADDPFDPQTLEAACRQSLASFKLPRAFIRVERLPRTALGKVQKHLLPIWKPEP